MNGSASRCMEMPTEILASLADAVGGLGADGALVPHNDRMRALLAELQVCRHDELTARLDAQGEAQAFGRGEPVLLAAGAGLWQLRQVNAAGGPWLVATDVTDEHAAAGCRAALARSRQLGQLAGSLLHDLCNQLNSAVALAAHVRAFLQDPAELALLDELTGGSKQGVDLLRTVVRLLPRERQRRQRLALRGLLTETAVAVGKLLRLQGADLELRLGGVESWVRMPEAEVGQVLLAAVTTLLDLRAQHLTCELEGGHHAFANGRPRPAVRVGFAGVLPHAADSAAAAAALGQLAGEGRGLYASRTPPGLSLAGFARAVLVLSALGGESRVGARDGAVTIDYWLPLAGTGG
ncbi:MAG: hypothetical protein JNN13_10610 [Planctomycetes bacterium]|nr:hypothetical protein [Planctomycetota bacterium]